MDWGLQGTRSTASRVVRLTLAALTLGLAACERPPTLMIVGPGPSASAGRTASAAARPTTAAPTGAQSIEVQKGDTLYGLARRHNVAIQGLIAANGLQPPYLLRVGQKLALPQGDWHVAQPGETLYSVSRSYNVDSYSLAQANDLRPPYAVSPGQRLRIPSAQPPVRVANIEAPATLPAESAPAAAPARSEAPQVQPPASTEPKPSAPSPVANPPAVVERPPEPAGEKAPEREVAAAIPRAPSREGPAFAWPLRGRILANFGPQPGGQHNDGINIAARQGDPVRAAEAGVVAYAGNELKGFGNLLLVRHADGWMTAYAHNDRLLVGRGDKIRRGQVIARVGRSGSVSSPQLHFEIRRGTQAIDPLQHLAEARLERTATGAD